MPRRSKRKTTTSEKPKKSPAQVVRESRLSHMKWGESYTSLLLGIVVVIIAVLFGVSVIHEQHKNIQQTSSIQTGPTTAAISPTATPTPPVGTTVTKDGQTMYTVKAGDNLWAISENFYQSGYKWTDIAKANNLSDPSTIHSGNTLIIPSIAPNAPNTPTPTVIATNSNNTITGGTYTVQKGDSLWDIAVRAYADGYRWTDIAKANNLTDPGLIFSGNVLQIPR